ncbi:ketopantoate reductase family protein [Desulfopila inferna]|uniref:ketopantoate reductase family protein n=1 Tax=Desulfopila inferna TaxID=468528 RepID=UPI0027D2062B|nr:2-dehydropantoate 2-reductase [Desulfopila inferna]
MRITVVGAGAMGCLFGGLLKLGRSDVVLVDVWQEHVAAINAKGLIIDKDKKRFVINVPACLPSQLQPPIDLLLLLTKSFNTEAALRDVAGCISESTHVMTLQNGVGHVETINKFVRKDKIIHGITTYPSDLIGPGQIETKGDGIVKVMSVDGSNGSTLGQIVEALHNAGMNCEITPDVSVAIWEKLAFNCAMNGLTTVLHMNVGMLGDSPEGLHLVGQMVEEIVSVARKKNIAVDKKRIMSTIAMAFMEHRQHHPSMLKDIMTKKKTEVESIHGAAIRQGAQLGLELPVNSTIYRLVKIIENETLKNEFYG